MVQFNNWCISADGLIGNHFRRVITAQAANLATGIQATAAVVPAHYASEEHVARALRRLGKLAAAALIEAKLPTTKAIRSGDLGEIYATEWIDTHSGGYHAPIKRLRWKDHRNIAMRGEDVIGILQDPQTQRLHFLKTEAKSRATLTAHVVTEARASLDKDGGLPSAHALSVPPRSHRSKPQEARQTHSHAATTASVKRLASAMPITPVAHRLAHWFKSYPRNQLAR